MTEGSERGNGIGATTEPKPGEAREPSPGWSAPGGEADLEFDVVLEASMESFPASDPPAWTKATMAP